jgi:hypothetical protein
MALTQDQLWTLDEQPIETQNVAAVTTGSGAVRSRFLLPESDQLLWPKPQWLERPRRVVDITTAFGRRGPLTVGSIEELPPGACETG